jgi:hypothetical protein
MAWRDPSAAWDGLNRSVLRAINAGYRRPVPETHVDFRGAGRSDSQIALFADHRQPVALRIARRELGRSGLGVGCSTRYRKRSIDEHVRILVGHRESTAPTAAVGEVGGPGRGQLAARAAELRAGDGTRHCAASELGEGQGILDCRRAREGDLSLGARLHAGRVRLRQRRNRALTRALAETCRRGTPGPRRRSKPAADRAPRRSLSPCCRDYSS